MRLKIFIALYMLGNVVFTMFADFDNQVWCDIYYVWQNLSFGGVFAWAAIYSKVKGVDKEQVKWVGVYSVFIFLWNLVALFVNLDVNNHVAVMVAFISAFVISSYLVICTNSRLAILLNRFLFK